MVVSCLAKCGSTKCTYWQLSKEQQLLFNQSPANVFIGMFCQYAKVN